ncbi:MAG: TonB-dependent receptor plug domain-containing protein [Candidatus Cryptobacteroides sp.]
MKGIISAIIIAAIFHTGASAGQHRTPESNMPGAFTSQVTATSPQDTTGIYGERKDSLEATVFTGRQEGNYLSRGKELRTEVISSAGLRKMACCNLAESFENSASVTVGYSDAVTGARQIRLLGLSGVYTQMLDENRPAMRGIAAPFGLSYVPGQWLESIQVAKGLSTVVNGVESITGQINTEYRKPTDEKPLFLNLSTMNDTKTDFNIASSLQMGESWSTVILGHVSGNFKTFDHNHDGFRDDPGMLQFNVANRWLYYGHTGVQVRFGLRALQDRRQGGQDGYDHVTYTLSPASPWGSDILNRSLNAYVKAGIPLSEDNSRNIAFVADYTLTEMQMWSGATKYMGTQNSGFFNVLLQNEFNDSHKLTLSLGGTADFYNENLARQVLAQHLEPGRTLTGEYAVGLGGEYTFHAGEKFSSIVGIRADWFNGEGIKFTPRLTLKYSPYDALVLRANAGRGLRRALPLIDNIGVFSTGKSFSGIFGQHLLEDAWTFGGNATFYLPFGASSNTYIGLDFFGTEFREQMVVDYENMLNTIDFYALDGKRSFSRSYQIDFNVEPIRRFTVSATFRYTDARLEMKGRGLTEKPLTSRYKGVLNLQYATNLNKWIFDFTASVNGKSRVYSFMEGLEDNDGKPLYKNGYSPAYPLLYLQVTKRFKGIDIYLGAENLTNFRQKSLLVGTPMEMLSGHMAAVNTSLPDFDASAVWGPIMGTTIYIGLRYTLWK